MEVKPVTMNRIKQNDDGLLSNFEYNNGVKANTDFLNTLKDKLPEFFTNSGSFDLDKFKRTLKESNIEELSSGYQLDFIGKNYAKKQAGERPTTVIVPDHEHNSKDNNKDSKNLFFTGDNLEVLRHLRQNYQNSVDVIYIDPPYNTGSDGFVYPDKFEYSDERLKDMFGLDDEELNRLKSIQGRASHSSWLTFMYPRLVIARKLLKDTGVIFISIDDNEQANLKVILTEVFGESNHVATICRQAIKGGSRAQNIKSVQDYVFVFSKNDTQMTPFTGFKKEDVILNLKDEKGPYARGRELNKWGAGSRREDSPSMWFPINGPEGDVFPIRNDGSEGRWRWGKKKLLQAVKDNDVIFEKRENGTYVAYEKIRGYQNDTTQFTTWFADKYINAKGSDSLKILFDTLMSLFDYAKPVELIHDLIFMSNHPDAIVLDFFAGSATTAEAVMKLNLEDEGNRRFLLAQLPEPLASDTIAAKLGYKTIDEVSRARIEKTANKIKTDSPLQSDSLDLGFKHYRVEEVAVDTINKMEVFDPKALFTEDLVADIQGGIDTMLTTWMVADGYKFDEPVNQVTFGNANAYYVDNQLLYIFDNSWNNESTKELLNHIGNHKININTIIVSQYALTFAHMSELKTNIKLLKDKDFNVKVEVHG